MFLDISQNSQENTSARVSFLIKLEARPACNLNKKETLAQVLSCEFCEISKDTLLYRTPPVAASSLARFTWCFLVHICSLYNWKQIEKKVAKSFYNSLNLNKFTLNKVYLYYSSILSSNCNVYLKYIKKTDQI